MREKNIVKLLFVVGIIFHVIYIWSIFDIYFQSPIIHGMQPISLNSTPPASRVAIFVLDGCRADKFFEANSTFRTEGRQAYFRIKGEKYNHGDGRKDTRIPFIRNAMENRGSWGVSHTGVPTESRPGHVALFAGFYEDVSAVTKGWKENPVEYDSVFNQSTNAFLFGSPDIVPMFAKHLEHVLAHHYSHEEEDFAKDASMLDIWVEYAFENLLSSANSTLETKLRSPKTVFFFHLLGMDTNGHAFRPYSLEYLANLAFVDCVVASITNKIEKFFDQDGQTTYMVTSDHGMSNKGAHGDGDPDNTRTPFVAWGAGVKDSSTETAHVETTIKHSPSLRSIQLQYNQAAEMAAEKDWNLDQKKRLDVMQADIAPLIAMLLGISVPMNSVGVLPLSYMNEGPYRAESIATNALQIFQQALTKSAKKESSALLFYPSTDLQDGITRCAKLQKYLRNKNYRLVETEAFALVKSSLQALDYFRKYDWLFLMTIVSLGYVGWIGVLIIIWMSMVFSKVIAAPTKQCSIYAVLLLLVYIKLFVENSPASYYLYCLFPTVYFTVIHVYSSVFTCQLSAFKENLPRNVKRAAVLVLGMEMIVLGYMHRQVFSLIFIVASAWPWVEGIAQKCENSVVVCSAWSIFCVTISIFPLLPTEYENNPILVCGSAIIACGVAAFCNISSAQGDVSTTTWFQLFTVIASAVVVYQTEILLLEKLKPPIFYRLCSWILAIGCVVIGVIFRTKRGDQTKNVLQNLFLSLLPAYVLLSISYELLFFVSLFMLLLSWVELERIIHHDNAATFYRSCRVAFFFLIFAKIGFFGTGNIASMSSFEISSTYRFVTIFSPFTMGALLIVKVLIPFVLVVGAFQVVAINLHQEPTSIFCLVLIMTDILSLNFLFLVQDHGSWKEIGSSISMFGIVNAQIVFLPLIYLLGKLYTKNYQAGMKID